MAVAVDSSGERRHLSVAEVSAISVLALRQPYTLARLAGDATVLDGRAEDLAQQPESILDRWGANVVGCHLRHPSAHRRRLHVDDSHVTPLGLDTAFPCAGSSEGCRRARPRC